MKKSKLILLTSLFCIIPCVSACNQNNIIDGIKFEVEEEVKGPRFLDGAINTIQIGESFILSEIVDTSVADEFKIEIIDPSGKSIDGQRYLSRPYRPSVPGDYKIVYTIDKGDNKGSATFNIKVVVKKISWSYTLQNRPYLYDEIMNFEEYFNDLNSYVDSYYDYKFVMDSVLVDDEEIDLHGKNEYQIKSMSDHIFKFHVEAEDGQIIEGRENISIKFINQSYLKEIESSNFKLYGELLVGDMNDPNDKSITMKVGHNNNGQITAVYDKAGPHDLPYIVYDKNCTIGDVVKIDFTGNNMPIMSFFRDDKYSSSLFDETKGVVVSNGFYNNLGGEVSPAICSRIDQYGPFMLYGYVDRDYLGDASPGTVAKPYEASSSYLSKLDQNNKYRLLCGYTGIRQSTGATYLTLNFALLDLTNHRLLGRFTRDTYNINSIGKDIRKLGENAYDFPADWYSGKIVLYGNYGKTTKIDCLPEIISLNGNSFDDVLKTDCGYVSSKFKDNTPQNLSVNTEYDQSLFGDVTPEGARVFISDLDGNELPLKNGKLYVETSGLYKVNYTDGTNFIVSKDIYVSNNKAEVVDGYTYYGAIKNSDNSTSFNAGYVSDGGTNVFPNSLNANDLSYVALNGNYGINDYLAVDFTGNNMPVMTFFRDSNNITGSLFDNSKGLVVMGGLYDGNGTYASKNISGSIRMYGPNLFYNAFDNDYLGDGSGGSFDNPFPGSQKYLEDHGENTHYKVVVGFSAFNSAQTKITLQYRLLDLDARKIIGSFTCESYNIKSIGRDIRHLGNAYDYIDESFFNGDIVLYGNYGKRIKIDSFEVTSAIDIDTLVREKYNFVPSEFATSAPNYLSINEPVSASLFGDLTNEGSYVYVISEDGKTRFDPVNGMITVTQNGNFVVVYNDGIHLDVSKNIYVSNLSNSKTGDINMHGTTVDGNKITLESGYIGNGAGYYGPNATGTVDQAFYAFDKNYGLDTYVELDFTGKNMPEIAFFANHYDNSMYEAKGDKDGIVFVNGVTNHKGEIMEDYVKGKVNFSGIHMIDNTTNGWFTQNANRSSKLSRSNLSDTTNYKLLIGFTSFNASALDLKWLLYDKNSKTIVEEDSMHTWNFFTGTYLDHNINGKKLESFAGSIVLYGKFGIQTKLDSVAIHENVSSFDTLKSNCIGK